MLILSGAPAVSDFRLQKLLAAIRDRADHVTGLDSRYLHFVDTGRELAADERRVLESLLHYGPAAPQAEPAGRVLMVVPRFGTVSPWSSKATDIAHVCGLGAVRRIERGIAWYLQGTREIDRAGLAAAATVLHDRMTETVLADAAEAEALFAHAAPRPLATVPLHAEGVAGRGGEVRLCRPKPGATRAQRESPKRSGSSRMPHGASEPPSRRAPRRPALVPGAGLRFQFADVQCGARDRRARVRGGGRRHGFRGPGRDHRLGLKGMIRLRRHTLVVFIHRGRA